MIKFISYIFISYKSMGATRSITRHERTARSQCLARSRRLLGTTGMLCKKRIYGTEIRVWANYVKIWGLSITGERKQARSRGQGLKRFQRLFKTVLNQLKELNIHRDHWIIRTRDIIVRIYHLSTVTRCYAHAHINEHTLLYILDIK